MDLITIGILKEKIDKALSETEIQAQINDRIYDGVDLTAKFADEIAASPYNDDPWAWIKARVQAGNYTGIHVRDWIPFTTTNNYTFNAQIAGINTYNRYGYQPMVADAVDFITKEVWIDKHKFNPVRYNNGVVPVETITADGETTEFILSKPMIAIDSIKRGSTTVTGYTYDAETYTVTFETAPAAGTLTVTGTGSEFPWLASDLYLWMNSLAGIVPNSSAANPDIQRVDYTEGGIYYYLPDELKAVITEKYIYMPKRYSSSGLLDNDNGQDYINVGKLWLPTEAEVSGACAANNSLYASGGSVQYPIFAGNMNRIKDTVGTATRTSWWVSTSAGDSHEQGTVIMSRGYTTVSRADVTSVDVPICFRIA